MSTSTKHEISKSDQMLIDLIDLIDLLELMELTDITSHCVKSKTCCLNLTDNTHVLIKEMRNITLSAVDKLSRFKSFKKTNSSFYVDNKRIINNV